MKMIKWAEAQCKDRGIDTETVVDWDTATLSGSATAVAELKEVEMEEAQPKE